MGTKGIQSKLSDGTVTEIRIGGTTSGKLVTTAEQLALKRDLTNRTFGGEVNNSEFEADGHLKFNNDASVWEDENFDPTMLTGNQTLPTLIAFSSTDLSIAAFANNVEDSVLACREYPHGAKLNESGQTAVGLYFHFHCFPASAGGGNVRLRLSYLFTEEGSASVVSGTLYLTAAMSETPWTMQSFSFASVPAPEALGSQLLFSFTRLGNDPLDTYAGNMAVSTIGFHYQMDGVGSRTQAVK